MPTTGVYKRSLIGQFGRFAMRKNTRVQKVPSLVLCRTQRAVFV
jgi:hypothetical protein